MSEARTASPGTPGAPRDDKGRAVVTDEPIVKAALLRFSEVGQHPIRFDSLLEWARQRLDLEPSPSDPEALASTLAQLHLAGMATLLPEPG
jgi:hypothetical protein